MRFWAGFAVGVGVGAGGTYLYLTRIRPPADHKPIQYPTPDVKDPASVVRYHEALKYGAPVSEYLRFYTNYVINFDSRTRNAKWVIERLTKETVNGTAERVDSNFFEDPGIEPRFRSRLSDYKRSGYDRGHLAPAANHKGSQEAMDETFTMSNISPQVGEGFNRDYWARFEKFVRDVTKHASEVYVITGPLFLPRPDGQGKWWMNFPLIGQPPALVSVPTHFYKVILADVPAGKDGRPKVAAGAFVLPNEKIEAGYPLEAFIVPLQQLETAAGMTFFPAYLQGKRQEVLDRAAVNLQQTARKALMTSETPKLLPPIIGFQPQVATLPMVEMPAYSDALGVSHLCEQLTCKLSSERFWEAKQ